MIEKRPREHASPLHSPIQAGSTPLFITALLSLIPSLIALAAAIAANTITSWSNLGVPSGDIQFGDLKTVTLASECIQIQPGWDTSQELCSTGTAPYNYPSWWARFMAVFGIRAADTELVGWIVIAIYLSALFALTVTINSHGIKARNNIVMSILALSPPSLLAMQRGNIDMVIFALITAGALISIRMKSSNNYLAAILIATATILKIYPAGAALIFLSRNRLKPLALFFALTIIGIISIASELRLITSRTPQIDGASFGSSLLPTLFIHRATGEWHQIYALAVGTGIFLVTWLVASKIRRVKAFTHAASQEILSLPITQTLFLAGSGTFLAAYLSGVNFDYRLIMLFIASAGLLITNGRISWVIAVILTALIFVSYSNFIGSLEYIADLAWLVAAPVLLIIVLQVTRSRLNSKT